MNLNKQNKISVLLKLIISLTIIMLISFYVYIT